MFIKTHKFAAGSSALAAIARALMATVGVTEPPVASPSASLVANVYKMLGAVPQRVEIESVAIPVRACACACGWRWSPCGRRRRVLWWCLWCGGRVVGLWCGAALLCYGVVRRGVLGCEGVLCCCLLLDT